MILDIERIVNDYLRGHPDVDARVRSNPPETTVDAWVQTRLLAAEEAGNAPVEHLVAYLLQLDCYAGRDGGQPEANDLARAVRAALTEMSGVHGGAVVGGARIAGHIRLPDDDGFEPARDREILTARIHAHP